MNWICRILGHKLKLHKDDVVCERCGKVMSDLELLLMIKKDMCVVLNEENSLNEIEKIFEFIIELGLVFLLFVLVLIPMLIAKKIKEVIKNDVQS